MATGNLNSPDALRGLPFAVKDLGAVLETEP